MKKTRQAKILELITNRVIDTQEGLQAALIEEGFNVAQATVSRDIKEMRIVKMLDSKGVCRYATSASKNINSSANVKYRDVFANSAISVVNAMNDVVVKCHPGMAQGACTAIDHLFSDWTVGTLAGDDTILAITKSESDAITLCKMLEELIF